MGRPEVAATNNVTGYYPPYRIFATYTVDSFESKKDEQHSNFEDIEDYRKV